MRPVKTFHVRPALPDRLRPLEELAYNLRWSWDHETLGLFLRLDRDLWEQSNHNPVLMLGSISQARLDEAAQDEAFLAHMDRVSAELGTYVAGTTAWYPRTYGPSTSPLVAYFSMEFGLTECLPIYSGGLGMLAGDHLKSASELGIPLVGVGLLYQKGYFRQYLTADGWQQERYPVNDFSVMPVRPFHDASGGHVRVVIELGNERLTVRPWRASVGRVSLVLLDANLEENPQHLQDITDQLYGGDTDMRIRQEIVLGIGGVRVLAALGLQPRLYHMNEGHCAFLALERIRVLMREQSLAFRDALEAVAASGIFTTHTPVPAGTDVFPPGVMERYFEAMRMDLGLAREAFLDLGRVHTGRVDEPFNMTAFALRTSSVTNGVSRLHGRVSRAMWKDLWPGVPVDEVPVAHVTNGVHAQSWISADMRNLYDRYLGPRWSEEPGDTRVWSRSEQIPGEELWRAHERRRERLVSFARRRLVQQLRARGAGMAELAQAEEVLEPEALTIGFARRFATYKRAALILRDPARLERILSAPGRPVQLLVAGKAHPRDEPGKQLIREITQLARRPEFRRRVVFLEDYDQVIARYMVQGSDVWLNTPRRPMEASGTSGMKAALNGALNLSVLDGWWDEAYTVGTGWAIGRGEEFADYEYQDRVEADALYDLLETEVIPLFYHRAADNVPRRWIALMKSAIGALGPVFNTNRMVHEYAVAAYVRVEARRDRLVQNGFRGARELACWKDRVRAAWPQVRIARVQVELPPQAVVGRDVEVRAWVSPAGLAAADLAVEVYLGPVDDAHHIVEAETVAMTYEDAPAADGLPFVARVPSTRSGTIGLTVRAYPAHPDLMHRHETGLITWATL